MKLYGNLGQLTPYPGTIDTVQCDICDVQMIVQRNVFGPTSFAESMGGGKHLHDVFACPNCAAAWHERIIELLHEAQNIKSRKLRAIVEAEIAEILKTKEVPTEDER